MLWRWILRNVSQVCLQKILLHMEVSSPQDSAINWLCNMGSLYSLGLCFLIYKMGRLDKRICEGLWQSVTIWFILESLSQWTGEKWSSCVRDKFPYSSEHEKLPFLHSVFNLDPTGFNKYLEEIDSHMVLDTSVILMYSFVTAQSL